MSSRGIKIKVHDFEQKYVHDVYDRLCQQQQQQQHQQQQQQTVSVKKSSLSLCPVWSASINHQLLTFNNSENTNNNKCRNGKCWTKIVEFLEGFSKTSIIGDVGKFQETIYFSADNLFI